MNPTKKTEECDMETQADFLPTTDKVKEEVKETEYSDTDSMVYDDTSESVVSFTGELQENQLIVINEKVDLERLTELEKLINQPKKSVETLFRELQTLTNTKIKVNDEKQATNNARENMEHIVEVFHRYSQKYKQHNYLPVAYKHSKKLTEKAVGRKYASFGLGLQSMPSVVRDYLLGNSNDGGLPLNTDIDIKNAHPSIALDIAKELGLDTPVLEEYVNNRQEFFDKYFDEEGVDKETMKTKIISMLNSQEFKKNKPYTKELANMDKEFKLIQNEVYKSDKYTDLKGLEDKTKNNPKGSFLNIIMTIVENKVLTSLYNALTEKGYKVNSLIFDGLLIVGNHYDNEELLELCNKSVDILSHTKLEIAFKPLGTILYDLLEENKEATIDVGDLPDIATKPKSQYDLDKEKTDEEWVNEVAEKLNKHDYLTDNCRVNYYANPVGGHYVATSEKGLLAEVIRNIQELFRGRKFLEKFSTIQKIANAYLHKIGQIELDTSTFDIKNIGVPFKNGVWRVRDEKLSKALPDEEVMKTTGYSLKLYSYDDPDMRELESMLMDCFNKCDHNYVKFQIGNLLLGNLKQFFILYGSTGNNGKTKCFCEFLILAFKNLSANMKQEHITTGSKKSVEGASPETMILKSSFINIISELNDDTQIDANAVKNLSGGNRMTAREMYSGVVNNFSMKGVMLIDTNKTGNINGYDEPTGKRMVVLHFPFEFINEDTYEKPSHRDQSEYKPMKDIGAFFTNTEDISSKCFSLIYHYYKEFSSNPDNSVISESLKIVRDNIAKSVCPISKFISECCETETNGNKEYRISADDIWNAFDYQQKGMIKKTSKTAFYGRMESLGYNKKKVRMFKNGENTTSLPYGYDGIRVRSENISAGGQFVKYYPTKDTANCYNPNGYDSDGGSSEATIPEVG